MSEEVVNAATEGAVSEAPQMSQEPMGEPVEQSAAPAEAPKSPEIDLDSLLKDPAARKKLFDHPDFKTDYEHRVSSEAGRRAKTQMEQAQARWQQEQERQRMLQMDDAELGSLLKRQQVEQEQLVTVKAEAYRGVASEIFGLVHSWDDFNDEERAKLVPTQYKSLSDYINAITEAKAQKIMSKQLPGKVKDESEALLREELTKIRGDAAPVPLAPAVAPTFRSEDDVHAYYINGSFGTRDNPYGGQAKKAYENALRVFGKEPPR